MIYIQIYTNRVKCGIAWWLDKFKYIDIDGNKVESDQVYGEAVNIKITYPE